MNRGLLGLDLDGVLIPNDSSWDLYHRILGTEEGRKRNMDLFFSGRIDYRTWAEMDADLWRGMSYRPIERYLEGLTVNEGAIELVSEMREMSVEIAIVSTGISSFAERISRILGIDTVIANEVETHGGEITGEVRTKCGFDEKGSKLRELGEGMGIPRSRWSCVGDDENDLSMFRIVPFSIAYNPKSAKLTEIATLTIESDNLHRVLRSLARHYDQFDV